MTDKLATQTKGSLAVVPDHLRQYVGAQDAEQNVTNDDILIPRLSVAQDGASPQLKRNNELFMPDLAPGDLFNSVTTEIYGTEATVIPLFFTKNYIRFAGGGVLKVLDMYANAGAVPDGDLSWGPIDTKSGKKTPPAVTEFKNRMSLVRTGGGMWQPVVVSFKKGENFFADQWNSQIKFAKLSDRLPCFAHTYTIKPKLKQDGQKSWYVKTVNPLGFTPQEIFEGAKEYFDTLSRGGYTVDTSGIEADADGATGDASFDNGSF